jgi:hypothetical protein
MAEGLKTQSPEAAETWKPAYDLAAEEVRSLCGDFLETPEIDVPEGKFGCYVIGTDSPYSNLGRYVEAKVFDETFSNSAELMEEEYGPYDESSEFYTVIDQEEKMPVGVMRIIKNSEAGLKSLEDLKALGLGFTKEEVLKGYGIDEDACVDVATLAVEQDYRGHKTGYLPSLLMYRTLYNQILSNPDYTHTVNIIDKKAEKSLSTLHFPFAPVFDSDYFSYLDSAESRVLLAQNSLFHPQLTYWVQKMRAENADQQDQMQTALANTIDALINPGFLDPMLSSSAAPRPN